MDSPHLLILPGAAWVGSGLTHGLIDIIAKTVAAIAGSVLALLILLLHLAVVLLGILVTLSGFRSRRGQNRGRR